MPTGHLSHSSALSHDPKSQVCQPEIKSNMDMNMSAKILESKQWKSSKVLGPNLGALSHYQGFFW